ANAECVDPSSDRAVRKSISEVASSWVSLHVGVPRKWHDHVVRVELPRLLAELNGRIDSWFFLRYSEPQGPCLRIRLHTARDEDWPVTVRASAAWAARLRETGLSAWNAFREYEPEVARYGGLEALPAAEDLFCADSSAVPRLLALRAAHRHLDDVTFGATLISLLTAAFAGGLVPGCDDDPAVVVALLGDIVPRDPLGDDRQHLARFTRLLNPREGWQGLREEVWGQALVQVTEGSRVAMRAWAARLGGLPPEAVAPAFASALHMTCNRLLGPTTEFERRLHLVAHAAAHANAQREVHLMGEQTCRQ
ncbi:MAG: thiopeptide-type bacteriocin biosynthesis protein, partial [Propioniciclava sp.]